MLLGCCMVSAAGNAYCVAPAAQRQILLFAGAFWPADVADGTAHCCLLVHAGLLMVQDAAYFWCMHAGACWWCWMLHARCPLKHRPAAMQLLLRGRLDYEHIP
jgi:hypothetical protein